MDFHPAPHCDCVFVRSYTKTMKSFLVTCPVRLETNDTADDVVPQMLRLLSGLTSVQVNVTSYNLQTDGNDADRSFLRLGMAHMESVLDTKTPFSDLSRLIRT